MKEATPQPTHIALSCTDCDERLRIELATVADDVLAWAIQAWARLHEECRDATASTIDTTKPTT